jgi:hypothetical protein
MRFERPAVFVHAQATEVSQSAEKLRGFFSAKGKLRKLEFLRNFRAAR